MSRPNAALAGRDRLRQIRRKADILSRREMRAFLLGDRSFLSCSLDRIDDLIVDEFDRLTQRISDLEGLS